MGNRRRQLIYSPMWAILLLLASAASVCAEGASDQFAVAASHYTQSRWELAVTEFQDLIARYPEDRRAVDARFFLGEAFIQLGRHGEARASFDEFLQVGAEHRFAKRALFRRGEAAYLSNQPELAEPDLKAFLAANPNDRLAAYALPYLAIATFKLNKFDEAEPLFTKARSQFPEGPQHRQTQFGSANLYEKTDRVELAIPLYEQLVHDATKPLAAQAEFRLAMIAYGRGKYADAIDRLARFESTYRSSPLIPDARYWLGLSVIGAKKLDIAAQVLTDAAKRFPDHVLAPAMRYQAGTALLQLKDYDAALVQFNQVSTNARPSQWDDKALFGKIRIRLAQGDTETATQLKNELASRHPESDRLAEATRLIGQQLAHAGEGDNAIELLAPLVAGQDQTATSPRDRYHLAVAYLDAGRHSEALTELAQVTEQSTGPLQTKALWVQASIYLFQDKFDAAAKLLEQCQVEHLTANEADQRLSQLAICYAHQRKFDQSQDAFVRWYPASNRDANDFRTVERLARLALAAGENTWAKELSQLLSQQDNDTQAAARGLFTLASSQYRADQLDDSVVTFGKVVTTYPEHTLAPQAALRRGQVLEQLDRPQAALATYLSAMKAYSESADVNEMTLRAAVIYDTLKQDSEAEQLLEQLIESHADWGKTDAAIYQLAWVKKDLGQIDPAMALFARLHEGFPKSKLWSDATFRLAQHQFDSGQHAAAERIVTKLIDANQQGSTLPHALYLQGQVFAAQGKWSSIEVPLTRLISDYPSNRLHLASEYWLAEAAYQQQNYEDAQKQFDRLAEQIIERDDTWIAMIPLRQAQLLAHDDRWSDAKTIAAGIAPRFPDFAQQHEVDYLLGRCLASQALFDEARAEYAKVIASPRAGKTETAAMAQWMIGESHFHQEDYEKAIRAYFRVEALYAFPHWQAGSLLEAGKCYELLGRWQQATELYSRILQQFAETSFAEEAGNRIRIARQHATPRSL